jgi:CRP-like cAMP-binding protein
MIDKKDDSASSARRFLSALPLFTELGESSMALLASMCRYKIIEKGEILYFQGDPSEFVCVVKSGEISISINSQDGRDMVINEMQAGDLFGEIGILTDQPRSTSTIGYTKAELLIIPQQTFLRILDEEPKFVRRLLVITAIRLQMSGERECTLAFKDAQARLAQLLLALDKAEDENGYITISQDELANRTGLIRQTVAKFLGKWRRSGWLLTGRGHIVILNHAALEEIGTNLFF